MNSHLLRRRRPKGWTRTGVGAGTQDVPIAMFIGQGNREAKGEGREGKEGK